MSWYAGSIPALQRVVGRLNRSVQIADERMGFVHAWQIEGVWLPGSRVSLYAPACAPAIRARRRTRNATPCPPPLTTVAGGLPEIFLTFSPQENFSHFFNLYDNQPKGAFVNGY